MSASTHNHYPRSPNLSTRSYDSSSVSSAASPRPPSQYLGSLMSAGARANPAHPPPQPIGIPPLPAANQSAFQPYTPVTATSVMGRDSLPSNESVASTPGLSSAQLSANVQAQKRAYRQRRKDPSCDACRERKVKCDATETTSCSECSSRNVKCQFTKETNRRMSSIKQVQDLERQIEKVKRENNSLKRMFNDRDGPLDTEIEESEQLPLQLPEIGSQPKRRKRPGPIQDLTRARANLRNFSKGIFKAPPPFRPSPISVLYDQPRPELPPRQATEQLLHAYYGAVHVMMPMIHWPTFQHDVDELYKGDNLQQAPVSWLSMFFAVLAMGSLFSPEPTNQRNYQATTLLDSARRLLDPWGNDHNLDHARSYFLISLAMNEMNLKSAAWNWLGTATKVAQDIGLHLELGYPSCVEADMRRRVWWSIFILDRSLSLEFGRPAMIDDADCDVLLPKAVDDHFLHEDGPHVPPHGEAYTHSLIAIINVVRSFPALIKALSTPVIATTRLSTFDHHFDLCQRAFPPPCDPSSNLPISPHLLMPVVYLLNARLLLHRHNLTPYCPPDVRTVAMEQCTRVAVETASLIARTNSSIGDMASSLVTMHIFRCTLFLLFMGHYEYAVTCVRALASINGRRDVAIPCGRFLAFFISTLASKRIEYADYANFISRTATPSFPPPPMPVRAGPTPLQDALQRDEELLAYVSADLQAAANIAWVWPGVEREPPMPGPVTGGGLLRPENRTGLTEEESRDWGGWDRVEGLLRGVISGTPSPAAAMAPGPSYTPQPGPGHPLPTIKLEPGSRSVTAGLESTGSSPTVGGKGRSSERISIANII